ncbi:protease inhibitor I42 family protein [Streptomyces sp. NPDC005263]|uniref:protease inhibitor I42 family protein n=1 Tax=Streptomyces sp. NPDC005263 TaxID=3364711 RepID=UPI0036C0DE72
MAPAHSTTRTASTSRIWAVVTAVAFLALATGCGGKDAGTGTGKSTNTDKPISRPTGDRTISAKVGERFTLTVEENASTREHWYLVDPKPDTSVVRGQGRESQSDSGDQPVPGAGSSLTFTFEATGKGSTEIVLKHCTFKAPCDGEGDVDGSGSASPTPTPTGSASPAPSPSGSAAPPEPERVTYTVTVS